ncbi:MAG: transporter substrate-binding domain-containing protein [Rhizobiales bacterium]|nr:transporter substrate-binding domain-containing protein [Hyphomicrobiales bacterium]
MVSHMLPVFGRLAAAVCLAATLATTAFAQSEPREVVVATRVLPPLVVDQKGALSGFSIELWNAIAERLKLKTSYQPAPDVRALLEEVRSEKVEIGVAAISITSAREVEFEFSQPILNAGLQIMIRGSGRDTDANPLTDLLGLLFSKTSLVWLGIALLLILIPAHIVWFLERRHNSGIIPTDKYIPGIFYAMYWSAATLATQAENQPRQWFARVVALFWMFTGIVFVALYTAQLTATLTVQQIQGGISGPDDLAGRKVATTRGSTAANVLRDLRAQVTEVARIDEAYEALQDRDVDAVVFDSPVLLYFAANEGKGRVHLVGVPFRKEDYGIIFRPNNPLRRQVNATLLQLREDGTYQQIYDKWFTSR